MIRHGYTRLPFSLRKEGLQKKNGVCSYHIHTSVASIHLQQRGFARAPRDLSLIPLKGITIQSLFYSSIKESYKEEKKKGTNKTSRHLGHYRLISLLYGQEAGLVFK